MEGKLRKYTHRSFLGNTWQERTFVCRGAELSYFAKDARGDAGEGAAGVAASATPVKTIDLHTVAHVRRMLNLQEFHLQYKDSKKAPYRLRAATKNLASRWIDVLRSRLDLPGESKTVSGGSSSSTGDKGNNGNTDGSNANSNNRRSSETKSNASEAGEGNVGQKEQKDHAVMSFFAAAGITHTDAADTIVNETSAVSHGSTTVASSTTAEGQPMLHRDNADVTKASESKRADDPTLASLSRNDIRDHLHFAEDPLAKSDLPWMNGGPCRTEGFLTKRGGKRKTWKRRWFKVTAKTLFYYASSSSSTPLGTVSLHGATVRTTTHVKYKHHFELVPSMSVQASFPRFARNIAMYAQSDREKREWLESLERIVLTPTEAIAMASGNVGKPLGGQLQATNDLMAVTMSNTTGTSAVPSNDVLSPWGSTQGPRDTGSRSSSSGQNNDPTLRVSFQENGSTISGTRQGQANVDQSQSTPPSASTTRTTGRRARASVVNLENEDEVWDYSETEDSHDELEQKMQAIELAQRRAALRVKKDKKKKLRRDRAHTRKKRAVHRRSERKIARAQKRAQLRVHAKVRQNRLGSDPLWNAPEIKDESSAAISIMTLDAATHESVPRSVSLVMPGSGSRRIRPTVRSTELARFELNDRMMYAESFGMPGQPKTPNNKSHVLGRSTPFLSMKSTARFGRTPRPTLPHSVRKTATQKRSYHQEAKASTDRGMHHLYGTRVLQSRQAYVTGTVKGGIFYHGHPADHVAPLQYSKLEDNTAFVVSSHCAVDPMTPPSHAMHPLARTRIRLQNEKDQKEEEDNAFLDDVDVVGEYRKQRHLMLASPAHVDLNVVSIDLSEVEDGVTGPKIVGRGREAEGYSVETIRANIAGGLESKNMKNASAMPSPGRAKLRLADLVSDDHPLHGRPSGVGAPSPPRVMPHMSSDDTDAAIQILENSIRQLNARLLDPKGVLGTLRQHTIGYNGSSHLATSQRSRLDVPTYLDTLETRGAVPTDQLGARQDSVPAVTGPRLPVVPKVQLRVNTGDGQNSRMLSVRATALYNQETYERGMSPALNRARSVYLDGKASKPSSPKASSGLSVETKKISAASTRSGSKDETEVKVPLIRQLNPREGWKSMVMAEWELQERKLEFVVEGLGNAPADVAGEGLTNVDAGAATVDSNPAGVMVAGNNALVRTSPKSVLPAVPETAEDESSLKADAASRQHRVADVVRGKSQHRKSRKRHGHRRLAQASLDALSGGDKNIFERVAGSYSKRR